MLVLIILFIQGVKALPLINSKNQQRNNREYNKAAQNDSMEFGDANIKEAKDNKQSENQPDSSYNAIVYDPVNLLVLGLDEYEERSDVMLLANFNPNNGRLNLLSLARDTRVQIGRRYTKINALVGIGGEELAIRKVEEFTGLPVSYYVTLNFEGFKKLIDILGGVEMNIKFNMNYDDPEQNLHIHLKKGKQVLNGEKAVQFVRYRKGNKPGTGYADGDLDRIKAQQKLIKALIEQKLKIKYLSKMDDIFDILKDHMRTNVEISDIHYYLPGISRIKFDEIKTFTIPGESVYRNRTWYYIHDEKRTRELIEKYFYK